MKILYLSPNALSDLANYCETSLLNYVLNDFTKNNKIVERKHDYGKPSKWWIVTENYITIPSTDYRRKMAVLLSFAHIGGFVEIEDESKNESEIAYGDVQVMQMLKKKKILSPEDEEYFLNAFWNFNHGSIVKFSL